MEIVFETDRLFLRKFTILDAAYIYQLNSDPDVTRYTLDPSVSLKEAEENLQNTILPQYALYGYGRWAVHLRDSGTFIGWCGLKARPALLETDLGYRFRKDA
jgi:ribosomal-protein-alanine N-acetyltransferase